MISTIGDGSIDLQLQTLPCPSPFEAALIGVPAFPVHRARFAAVGRTLDALAIVLTRRHSLQHELFYQSWKLSPTNGANLISDNLTAWSPDLGLGVWPDREPPSGWTEERMVDAAAATFRGEEPDVPNPQVLRNTAAASQIGRAATAMRGLGVQIETFSAQSFTQIEELAMEVLLPTISERRFRSAAFYLPLLDAKTVDRASALGALKTWMCGVEVYVRESAEDKGVLLISSFPLQHLLSEVQEELLKRQVEPQQT